MKQYHITYNNIYNIDEKGFMLGQGQKQHVVVYRARTNKAILQQQGGRESVTIIEAVEAWGKMLPPLIIVKIHKHLVGWYQELHNTQDEVSYHGCSENGWTDNQMALLG